MILVLGGERVMSRSIFGWSLPPGCSFRDADQLFDEGEQEGEREERDEELYEDHVTGPATDAADDDPRDFDQMAKDGDL